MKPASYMYFSRWLRAEKDRRGPVGDLARDFAAHGHGNCCTRFRKYESIRNHILTVHTPCLETIEALEQAYREYQEDGSFSVR